MVAPGDDFGQIDQPLLTVDDFKKIYERLSKEKVTQFLAKDYSKITPTDIKVMSMLFCKISYYILDEGDINALIKLTKKNLHVDILIKAEDMMAITYNLSVYLSLFTHFKTDYDSEMQEFVIQWIVGNFTQNFVVKVEQDQSKKSFQLSVLLKFLAEMMDYQGMNKFTKIISYIPEDTLMQDSKKEGEEG